MIIILCLAYVFIVLLAAFVWHGYVFMRPWDWFLVPALGVHPISISAAIGLSITIAFITNQHIPDNDEFNEDYIIKDIMRLALRPLLLLGIGWIVAQWM